MVEPEGCHYPTLNGLANAGQRIILSLARRVATGQFGDGREITATILFIEALNLYLVAINLHFLAKFARYPQTIQASECR